MCLSKLPGEEASLGTYTHPQVVVGTVNQDYAHHSYIKQLHSSIRLANDFHPETGISLEINGKTRLNGG